MASTIVWIPTRNSLAADLAAITPDSDPRRLVGDAILARLNAVGGTYDDFFGVGSTLRALMDAEEADQAAAYSAWASSTATAYARADRHARYCESLAVTAQTGRLLDPRIAVLSDGTRYVLAPLLALPVSSPFDDDGDGTGNGVDQPVAATLTLSSSAPLPVVKITARVGGKAGNQIEANVSAATDGVSTHFKLLLRLGTAGAYYTEVFDNLDASSSPPSLGSQDASLLIAPLESVGRGRPVDSGGGGYTHLAGGAARLLQTLQDRCSRAVLLTATEGVSATEKRLVVAARTAAEETWAGKPVYTSRLASQEAALNAALAEATAMLAFLGWGG